MRFSLPALTSALAILAQKPEIGVESAVYVSAVPIVKLGVVSIDAAGTASWRATPGVTIPAGGLDLHLRTEAGIPVQTANPAVTLNVTMVGATTGTAVATLAIPSWVSDQNKVFGVGAAEDFIPQGAGNTAKLITVITGVAAAVNVAPNSTFTVYGSSPVTDYALMGYKRNAGGDYQVPGTVEIADRYQSAAAVKQGRSESSKLTLEFGHISSRDGMTRYNGTQVAVWIQVIKDKQAATENIVYIGYRGASSPNRSDDGNAEVKETSTGPYESFMTFVAG